MSGMSLETMQRRMLAAVMQPLTPEDTMRERNEAGERMADVAAEFVAPNDRLTAFERLEIYNRQYWFRLMGAFAEDFPALRRVLGSRRYDALAVAYLQEHPSRSFTLRNLGRELVGWLEKHPEYLGRRKRLALDVARVEWACVEAFDNGELAPLTAEEIGELTGGSRLGLQPHLQLLELDFPADDVVLELHQRERKGASEGGARPEMEEMEPERLEVERQRTWLAVHRAENSLYYRRITREEYQTLKAIASGLGLGEALEAGFRRSRIALAARPSALQEWFAHWARLGWLSRPDSEERA